MSQSIKEYIEYLSDLKAKSEDRDGTYARFSIRAKIDTLSFIDGLASYYGQSRADVIEEILEDSIMELFISIPEHEKIPVLLQVSQKTFEAEEDLEPRETIWRSMLEELQSKEGK